MKKIIFFKFILLFCFSGFCAEVKILEELPVKYSLGSMYSSFTSKIGFKTNEEGKTMGLAPYGTSRIYNKLKQELIFNKKKYDFRNW